MNEDTKILTLYSNEQDFIKDFGVKTTKKKNLELQVW